MKKGAPKNGIGQIVGLCLLLLMLGASGPTQAGGIKMIDNTLYGDWLYNPRTYDRERFYLKRIGEVREDEILSRIRMERLLSENQESLKSSGKKTNKEIYAFPVD